MTARRVVFRRCGIEPRLQRRLPRHKVIALQLAEDFQRDLLAGRSLLQPLFVVVQQFTDARRLFGLPFERVDKLQDDPREDTDQQTDASGDPDAATPALQRLAASVLSTSSLHGSFPNW